MIDIGTSGTRPLLVAVATLFLTACGDGDQGLPTNLQTELGETTRELEQTRSALGMAEKRLASMREEQTQDRRRLAELTAGTARLVRHNYELEQQLASARARLAQQSRIESALRQQRDQQVRRVRDLTSERQALHATLARANGEIQRLRSSRSPDRGRVADLRYPGTVSAREVEELRRYNGFLLQERGNLQAWLEESNAARAKQQQALSDAEHEVARIEAAQSAADALNRRLQSDLEANKRELADAKSSRDALGEEIESLRAEASRLAASERSHSEQLKKAQAHASALAEAHEALPTELESPENTKGDVAALRAALDEADERIARLKIAKDYLVEKIEACTSTQQSSSTASMQRAFLNAWLQDRVEIAAAARARNPLMTTHWRMAPVPTRLEPARLIAVASADEDASKSSRYERELKETREKLATLKRDHEALLKEMEKTQAEYAAVKEQVETLTWANKELVKELDSAYASREAGMSTPLPKGARGVYVLREGESLSRVAKAFYGDPDRWKDIVAANKEKIPDPNMVKAGTIILIPE